MANYDSVLERTAVVIVVDDSKLQTELKKATDQVKRAAKDQADAQKPVARSTGEAEKGFAELRAEITRLRAATERVKREADAYLATQKQQAAAARADAAAQKELDGRIKELGLQVRNTRSAFINGRIAQSEFARSSEALKTEINELLDSTTLTTAQQLKLNIASATAQRGLSSVRGEASRLGLAWNVQIGIANQFGQQLRNLGPVGAAAAGGLGLVQNGFAGLQRPIDLSNVSLNRFLAAAVRAPQVLALATAAATTFAIVGLARLATNAAKTADEIDKASQSAGLGAEAFQEITFALSQNGVSLDQARQGLNDFNARLGQAAQGSTSVAKAYADLGVTVRDANGEVRDGEAVFTDLITALSGVESTALQAAIGGQVFGEEFSRRLIPTLKSGADGFAELREQARAMGLVVSGDAILSLVEFKDEMAVLERQFSTARVEIAAAFLPILRDVLMPLIQNTVIPWIQTAADRVSTFATRFTEAGTAGDTFRAQLVDLLTPLLRIADVITGVSLGFVSFANFVGGAAAAAGAAIGTLSVQLEGYIERLRDLAPVFASIGQLGVNPIQAGIDLVQAFRNLPSGALQSPFDGAAIAESAGAASAPFFERGTNASLAAGDALRRAFGGYDGLFDGLAEAGREALARGASGAFGSTPPPGTTPPPAGTETDPVVVSFSRTATPVLFARQQLAAQQGVNGTPRTPRDFAMLGDRGVTRGDGGLGIVLASRASAEAALIESVRQAGTLRRQAYTIQAQQDTSAAAEVAAAEAAANQVIIDSVRDAGALRRRAYFLAAQAEAAAARDARATLLAGIGAGAPSDRGRTRGSGLMSGGDLFTPPGSTSMFPTGLAADLALRDAVAAQQAAIAADAARAGQFTMLSDRGLTRGDGGVAEAARLLKEQADKADAFANTVVDSAFAFSNEIVNSIRNGDIGQAFKAVLGAGQSILGAADFGGLSFLGGSIPIAGLISGAVGLIGNLFGGLFGGGQGNAEAARAAGNAPRGAPSVELNLSVFQNLAVQSLTGADRAAVDGLLDQTVSRIESVLVSFGNRLTAVEARTA